MKIDNEENKAYKVRLSTSEKNKDIIDKINSLMEDKRAIILGASIIKIYAPTGQKKRFLFFKKDVYKDRYFFKIFYRKKDWPNASIYKFNLDYPFDTFDSAKDCFNDIFEIGESEDSISIIDAPFSIIAEFMPTSGCGNSLYLIRDSYTDNIYIATIENDKITSISPYYTSDQKILTYREWSKVKWAIGNKSKVGRNI